MLSFLSKIFGTKNERELKRLLEIVDGISKLESQVASLSTEQLAAKTEEFKNRLSSGKTIDSILKESFAVVRETSRRLLNMRHFDVQLIGGIVLHEGKIAEMKTGEGKTLVATLPIYLNALEGRGVHLVTVNDYLAKRDILWMGPIYHFLGLSVGLIQHDNSFIFDPAYVSDDKRFNHLKPCTRSEAYLADVTYATNNELGFDYLRDGMKYDLSDYCLRELNYAIVDEVDCILIDEARTPLIISGPAEESTDKYYKIDRIIPNLKADEDFKIDEKLKTVILTESGSSKAEKLLDVSNLYDPGNIGLVHHVLQATKAHHLFAKDVDYVVKDGEVLIVDEFTGRLMQGRRWSDGLHQAVEAKEGVKIASENQTLATITFQNYFRMYNKLAGMTGTADTEAAEFAQIYNLDVIAAPTNKPMLRTENPDRIYKNHNAKFGALINEIKDRHEKGQPILIGTTSIEKSEVVNHLLKKNKINHSVLNAKYHEKEADIIAQTGRLAAVTVATNMAGRGTDIVLGGNPERLKMEFLKDKKRYSEEDLESAYKKAKEICDKEREQVLAAGGLHIIGTERHESRRIDNQLRGRAGRQGDPGSSTFYLSLEDDLMRIFGSDKINSLMNMLQIDEETPIENKMVTKAIGNAQKKVEAHHFDMRKHLLDYDDVMDNQRKEIYSFRRDILQGKSLQDKILEMIDGEVDEILSVYCPEDADIDELDLDGLVDAIYGLFSIRLQIDDFEAIDDIRELIISNVKEVYENKEKEADPKFMRYIEKVIFLQVIDTRWKDHLLSIDHLKEGIGLRGYAQRNPLVEYRKEAFGLFADMSQRITTEVLTRLFKIQIRREDENAIKMESHQNLVYSKKAESSEDSKQQPIQKGKKIGRNDPCPCGSGKKHKKCCETR